MSPEIHLFIVWSSAKDFFPAIIDDISKKLLIKDVYHIEWTPELFSQNLTRFYGQSLPAGSDKENHIGTEGFYAVLVQDNNPDYQERETTKGNVSVNKNIFDLKQAYRELTGGGHKIHATNTVAESIHDIWLLLKLHHDALIEKEVWSGSLHYIKQDLLGATGWESIEDLFYSLNLLSNYIVLRNYECLPSDYFLEEHGDIDLLVESVLDTVFITNAEKVFPEDHRVHYAIKIAGETIPFDFRFVGDDYYCHSFQSQLLKNKIFNSKGFFTPSVTDYFFSLLYHALIHKPFFSNDYSKRLSILAKDAGIEFNGGELHGILLLRNFFYKNSFHLIRPIDSSVFYRYIWEDYFLKASYFINEKYISVLGNIEDLSLYSSELRQHCDNLIDYDHFSATRANILRPFEKILSGNVLELGAGCGTITRYLGEQGLEVTAVEGNLQRAEIARLRNRDLPNITVKFSLSELLANKKYDVIVIAGIKNNAEFLLPSNDPLEDLLSFSTQLLKPNGLLIIAENNLLALRNFSAGIYPSRIEYADSANDIYFKSSLLGHEQWRDKMSSLGLSHFNVMMPFPSYAHPVSIIRSSATSNENFDRSAFAWQSARRDPGLPYHVNFSTEMAWLDVFKNNVSFDLANSFVFCASAGPISMDDDIVAHHYSSDRLAPYCKEIFFEQVDTGEITVKYKSYIHNPASQDSKKLLFSLPENVPYSKGEILSLEFIKLLSVDNWSINKAYQFFERYLVILSGIEGFPKISRKKLTIKTILPGIFFDLTPNNLIVTEHGKTSVIDKEWVLQDGVELGYLIFRGLINLLGSITHFGRSSSLKVYKKIEFIHEIFSALKFSLSAAEVDAYIKLEATLQEIVTGCEARHYLEWYPEQELISYNSSNLLSEKDKKIEYLSTQLNEISIYSEKQRKKSIDDDAIIGQLNKSIESASNWGNDLYSKLVNAESKIVELNQLVSEASGWGKSLESAVHERDQQVLKLNETISEVSLWANSLKQDIEERDSFINSSQEKLTEFSNWVESLKRDLQQKEEKIVQLNAEIDKVSSWASSLEKEVAKRDVTINQLNASVEEISTWAKSLDEQVNSRDAIIEKLKTSIHDVSSWAASLENEVKSRDITITNLSGSVNEVSFWAESLKNELIHKNEEIVVLNSKVSDVVQWAELLQTKVDSRDDTIGDLNAKIDEVSSWAQSLKADLNRKDEILQEYVGKVSNLTAENESLIVNLVKKDDAILDLNYKNYNVSQIALNLQSVLNMKLAEIDQLNGALEHQAEENFYLTSQLKDAQNLVQSIQDQLVSAEIKNINLQNEINTANDSFASLKHEYDKLKFEYENINVELLKISDWASTIDRNPIKYGLKKYISRLVRGVYRRLPLSISTKQKLRSYISYQGFRSPSEVENDINLVLNNPTVATVANIENRDVFVFAVIDWHFRIQRPQHLAKGLAKAGRRVFYFSNHFVDDATPGYQLERLDPHLELYQIKLNIAGAPAIYFDAPTAQAQTMLEQSMAIFMADYSCVSSISILQHAYWYDLAKKVPNTIKTYDCMDHHEGFGNVPEKLIAIEKSMLAESDFVIVTSTWLEDFAKDYNKNIVTVRNACEYQHFCNLPESRYVDSEGRKIIGYYGAIAEWFDVEIIKDLAQKHPEYLILLVGADTAGAQQQLSEYKNIIFTGEVPYASLPYYLYAFDVCLLPFQVIPLTLATNPVKVYEYLSSGKPVVCIDLPEISQFGDLVFKASNSSEFTLQVARALEKKSNTEKIIAARKKFAAEQTWDHRASDIVKAIQHVSLPKVSVIVLTYNNLELTKACLDSLYKYSLYPNLEVIIVDNASSDETPQYLQEFNKIHPDAVVILNKDNLGFSAGNNVGLAAATGDYLVLLNNDTYVTPGWVLTMLNHLRFDNSIGIIGPVTNNIGNEAKIDINYADMEEMHKYAKGYTLSHMGQRILISTTAFFCVMIPRHVYEKVGPMDEKFGRGFFEDDDYCRRIEKIDLNVACADDVFIHHHLSASFNKLGAEVKQKLFEDNKAYYEGKWGTWVPHKYRS